MRSPNSEFDIRRSDSVKSCFEFLPKANRSFKRAMLTHRGDEYRIFSDAAALEADEVYAQIGGMSVTICGRHNPERIAGWMVLVAEAPTLLSLALVPDQIWHASIDHVRQVAVWASVTTDWGNEHWILGTLWSYLGVLIIVCLLRKYERMAWFQGIVLDLLFVRIVCRAASMMVCSTRESQVLMRALPSNECGSPMHAAYACIGAALFLVLYVNALHYTVKTKENRRPAFRYNPRFNVMVGMAKAFVASLAVWFRESYPDIALAGLALATAWLCGFNVYLVPCYGRGRHANNLRTATFGTTVWMSTCGCVSYYTGRPKDVATTAFVMLPIIAAACGHWNDRYAKMRSIPNESIRTLMRNSHMYVKEVACCTIAHRADPTSSYSTDLSRILLKPPTQSELSLHLWAAIGLLRGVRTPERKFSRLKMALKNSKILPAMGIQFRTSTIKYQSSNTRLEPAFRFLAHLVVDTRVPNHQLLRASSAVVDMCDAEEVGCRAWILANVCCVAQSHYAAQTCELLITIQKHTIESLDALSDDDVQYVVRNLTAAYFGIRSTTSVLLDVTSIQALLLESNEAVRSLNLVVENLTFLTDWKFSTIHSSIFLILNRMVCDGLLLAWEEGIQIAVESFVRTALSRHEEHAHLATSCTALYELVDRIDQLRLAIAQAERPTLALRAITPPDVPFVIHHLDSDSPIRTALYERAVFTHQMQVLLNTPLS